MTLRQLAPAILFRCLPLMAGGCTSVPAEECLGQNWYERGYADAMAGEHTDQFLVYQSSCPHHGITPGRTSYLAGWVDAQGSGAR